MQGFHRTYATGAACQQRTLIPPDTWSCPTLGLACVLMSRPISPELVLSPDLWILNTPRYFSFPLIFGILSLFNFTYKMNNVLSINNPGFDNNLCQIWWTWDDVQTRDKTFGIIFKKIRLCITVLRQNIRLRLRHLSNYRTCIPVWSQFGCDMMNISIYAKVKGHPERHS